VTKVRTPREAFLALIEVNGAQRWDELTDFCSMDATVRRPFANDASALLVGRDQLREHFLGAKRTGIAMKAHDVVVRETRDAEVVVGEFTYHTRDRQGTEFKVPPVFVLRVRNREIIESRDYFGPRLTPM